MKYKNVLMLVLICILTMPPVAVASDFDGSKPLICTLVKAMECTMAKGCQEVMAGDINMPRFIWIDVGKKIMQNKKTGDNVRKSEIERIEVVDNKLILQGAEQGREDLRDGFGWTMAIMQDTGQLVLSASGDHVGDVIFGFCTPQ